MVQLKVLVAEDDEAYRLILRKHMERLGHLATVVSDGRQAVMALEREHFDVVISDWMMPHIEGPALCQHLRAQPDWPYTFFILLTALEDKGHFLEGIRVGADDYLVKPLDVDQLQARLLVAQRVTAVHRALDEKSHALEAAYRELHATARVDPLTGVRNRLALEEDLVALQAEVDRYGHRYCVALCDIDYFKLYNDTYGHRAGDDALAKVGAVLRAEARRGDRVYRYGGEEFFLVLPEQDLRGALMALERLKGCVMTLGISHEQNPPRGVVTLSAGVAFLAPTALRSTAQSVEQADKALYEAKAAGRNCVRYAASDVALITTP